MKTLITLILAIAATLICAESQDYKQNPDVNPEPLPKPAPILPPLARPTPILPPLAKPAPIPIPEPLPKNPSLHKKNFFGRWIVFSCFSTKGKPPI